MVSSLSSSVTPGFYYCGLWFVIFDSRWARLNPQRAAYIHQKWAYEVGGALVVGVPDYSIVTNILRRRKATCNEINLPRPGRPLPGLGRKSCGMDSPLAGMMVKACPSRIEDHKPKPTMLEAWHNR